jgi:hypothetical protein
MNNQTKETIKEIRSDIKRYSAIQKYNRNAHKANYREKKIVQPLRDYTGEEVTSYSCFENIDFSEKITQLHILLNRIRGRKPHCGDEMVDAKHLPEGIVYKPDTYKDVRLYVLVNEKLSSSQRIPQASHAVAELVFDYGSLMKDWITNHKTIVVLSASEEEIQKQVLTFTGKDIPSRSFYDSDLENMLTAVAFMPMPHRTGKKHFSCLPLA